MLTRAGFSGYLVFIVDVRVESSAIGLIKTPHKIRTVLSLKVFLFVAISLQQMRRFFGYLYKVLT